MVFLCKKEIWSAENISKNLLNLNPNRLKIRKTLIQISSDMRIQDLRILAYVPKNSKLPIYIVTPSQSDSAARHKF